MRIVDESAVENKRVLLRLDLDVPLDEVDGQIEVADDTRLQSGLETLELCLEYAKEVIVMGHLGRPDGKEDPKLSVAPIVNWFESQGIYIGTHQGVQFEVLENLRFEIGEQECSPSFARELAILGDVFVNESFAAYREAASTTLISDLIPSYAGLQFAQEVEQILKIRNHPLNPYVVIIGGAKVEDKVKLIDYLSKIADCVLIGGKLVTEIKDKKLTFARNVILATLNDQGTDITQSTIDSWSRIISLARSIVWNGPVGKVDDLQFQHGSIELAKAIFQSQAEILIGGGDTVGFLTTQKLLVPSDKLFVSTGGGAMLKLLESGTLPTIQALNQWT